MPTLSKNAIAIMVENWILGGVCSAPRSDGSSHTVLAELLREQSAEYVWEMLSNTPSRNHAFASMADEYRSYLVEEQIIEDVARGDSPVYGIETAGYRFEAPREAIAGAIAHLSSRGLLVTGPDHAKTLEVAS